MTAPAPPPPGPLPSSPTLLVADSDPLQRQLIDMLLSLDGYQLVAVASGREALQYLKSNTPDLIMLALELPDISGSDICVRVKKVTRLSEVPVVLLAEGREQPNVDERARQAARLAGADLLLQKPLGDKNLRERLKRLLHSRYGEAEPPAPAPAGSTAARQPGGADGGGHSTAVIEQTLAALDGAPAETQLTALKRENRALRERVAELEARLERAAPADAGPTAPEAAPDAAPEHPSAAEQQRTIEELERRNRLLVEALRNREQEPAARGGLFSRRRS